MDDGEDEEGMVRVRVMMKMMVMMMIVVVVVVVVDDTVRRPSVRRPRNSNRDLDVA